VNFLLLLEVDDRNERTFGNEPFGQRLYYLTIREQSVDNKKCYTNVKYYLLSTNFESKVA